MLVKPPQKVIYAPHRVILTGQARPKWQSKMAMALKGKAPGWEAEGFPPPFREEDWGGGPISPGWLLWLYPCV